MKAKNKTGQAGTNRRRFAMLMAFILVTAIILGGTYAWTSISQKALNEAKGLPNPGGRVHDDYEGLDENRKDGFINKDIYAENFGTVPLYVRIRLDEYMETGTGAGLKSEGGGLPNIQNAATSFVDGAEIDDKDTWETHIPGAASCSSCNQGTLPAHKFHKYISWNLGGEKIYMPTYNQNLNDKTTEASGKAIDEIKEDQTAIGRYIYVEGSNHLNGDTGNTECDDCVIQFVEDNDGTHDFWKPGDKTIGDLYEWDPNINAPVGDIKTTEKVTHTAKPTLTPDNGGVMSMAEWLALGSPLGNFWVYDTDGWAYWANALAPGEATSLLLTGITINQPDEEWYYAINVVGQFATAADLGVFSNTAEGDTITADAAYLLDKASSNSFLYSMTLDKETLDIGTDDTYQFRAYVLRDGVPVSGMTLKWKIEGTVLPETTIDTDGLLAVNELETAANFIVKVSWHEFEAECEVTVTSS